MWISWPSLLIRITCNHCGDIPLPSDPGDFDGDVDVDGRDFLAWQRGESPDPLSVDDLATWQEHYGEAGSLSALAAVPEPSTMLMLISAGACFAMRRHAA